MARPLVHGEKTVVMRVPESLVPAVQDFIASHSLVSDVRKRPARKRSSKKKDQEVTQNFMQFMLGKAADDLPSDSLESFTVGFSSGAAYQQALMIGSLVDDPRDALALIRQSADAKFPEIAASEYVARATIQGLSDGNFYRKNPNSELFSDDGDLKLLADDGNSQ